MPTPPASIILGSASYEREDVFLSRQAEDKSFSAFLQHVSTCPKCKRNRGLAIASIKKTDVSGFCNEGDKLFTKWSTDSIGLEQKIGKVRTKKRQFGNIRPNKTPTVHPHKGPICLKKDPSGHCLKWGKHKSGRKIKPKHPKAKWS